MGQTQSQRKFFCHLLIVWRAEGKGSQETPVVQPEKLTKCSLLGMGAF